MAENRDTGKEMKENKSSVTAAVTALVRYGVDRGLIRIYASGRRRTGGFHSSYRRL